jgi:toxin CcdB
MAQFDVYKGPEGVEYLLDLQTDLIEFVESRVVAPLLPIAKISFVAKRLNPVFDVEGKPVVLVVQALAAVRKTVLGRRVANLSDHHRQIIDAVDMLFLGF